MNSKLGNKISLSRHPMSKREHLRCNLLTCSSVYLNCKATAKSFKKNFIVAFFKGSFINSIAVICYFSKVNYLNYFTKTY